jgi:hypothetical protein
MSELASALVEHPNLATDLELHVSCEPECLLRFLAALAVIFVPELIVPFIRIP